MTAEGTQDPADASRELRARLEAGRVAAGLNKTELARRAQRARTSVSAALNPGHGIPTADTVGALARALKLDVHALLQLRAAAAGDLDDAAVPDQGDTPRSPLGVSVEEADDTYAVDHLGVHHSIDPVLPPLTSLTPYVRRPHDLRLESVGRAAEVSSQMAVLVGDSSTGKTRALQVVVLLHELAKWRLWQPHSPEQFLETHRRQHIAPHTVLWLNETQRYLTGPLGEETACALRTLLADPLRSPVLVLGTLWREHHSLLTVRPRPTEQDPHAQARDLLDGRCITVPNAFTDDELDHLAQVAPQDRRLALAVEQGGRHVTQFLAGAHELVRRFEAAPAEAQAVILAAMDARRLGHGPSLSPALLRAAAPGYLSDQQWQLMDDDWFEKGLDYARQPCKGVPGPLTAWRPRPGDAAPAETVLRLADYLEQYARNTRRFTVPPAAFWNAAAHHAGSAADLMALAGAADDRWLRRQASLLYQAAADKGLPRAWVELGNLHDRVGHRATAVRCFQAAADAGDVDGLIRLARIRGQSGDAAEALRLYQAAARRVEDAAEPVPDAAGLVGLLAMPLASAGDTDGAERLCRALADAGNDDQWVWAYLSKLRMRAADLEGAEAPAREAARRGDYTYMLDLVAAWRADGDEVRADRLFDQLIDVSPTMAVGEMALSPSRLGPEQAERLHQVIEEREGADALWVRAARLHEAGDFAGAEALYQACVAAGDHSAHDELAVLRMEAGDFDGAEEYVLRGATQTGNWHIGDELATVYRENGRLARLRSFCQKAADQEFTWGLVSLARLLDEAGEHVEAESLAFKAVAAGDPSPLWLLGNGGDDPRRRQLLRYGLEPNGRVADPWS
ncbi:helix-turn-helix transcriptional regulator [Streptomyces sp. MZ04]|uniref:helix-turn-helix domain-containing protein n=1 Tax=Streptomyces sp. MZ04 TaxID=2559236 RepID=UPI00107E9C15|nr:helix-turn-helix transcriptional regulator [Streptomyces sp. MZ04]TGA91600.1 XRE family transcriptional regulator [Streptomyces sp. MZ04]